MFQAYKGQRAAQTLGSTKQLQKAKYNQLNCMRIIIFIYEEYQVYQLLVVSLGTANMQE